MKETRALKNDKYLFDVYYNNLSQIDWAMWEAIGTVSAALVGIILAAREFIISYFSKPKIELDLCIENPITGYDPNYTRKYNFKISNKNSTPAKNVVVRIKKYEFIKKSQNIEDVDINFLKEDTIQWEDFHIFSIVSRVIWDTRLRIGKNIDPTSVISANLIKEIEGQDFEATLLISGDNFKGFLKKVKYTHDNDIKKSEMKIIEN